MVCKQCGAQIYPGAKFCSNCSCSVPANQDGTQTPIGTNSKQPKKKPSFSKTLLAVFCCIMVFVLSLSALTLFTVRGILQEDRVDDLLDSSNIEPLVENSNMEDQMKGMDADAFEKIYRKTSVGDYVKDTVKDYTEYLLGGSTPKGVDVDDVLELMWENRYEIEEITGEPMTEGDFERADAFFDDNGEENLGVFSSKVRTSSTLKTIRTFLSLPLILFLLVLVALFIFLIFKARNFRLDALIWISIPLILVSLLFGVFLAVKPILLAMLGGFDSVITEAVSLILSGILDLVLINSGAVLFTGILLIVAFVTVRKWKASR